MQIAKGRSKRETLIQLLGLFAKGQLVDLGTGHGDWAVLAADLGWEVTGVDARTERWPEDDRIKWVESDIREHDVARYDLVLCLGLFYHLTADDQLDLLSRSRAPVIIDTHLDHGVHDFPLSEQVTVKDRYVGRFFREINATGSSWGNRDSFWPTLESFHRMLDDCGYGHVLTLQPWGTGDRTFFLALPNRNQPPGRNAVVGGHAPLKAGTDKSG